MNFPTIQKIKNTLKKSIMQQSELIFFNHVQDAINYVLDNNLFRIDLVEFETILTRKLVYDAKQYNLCFILDELHILDKP